MALRLPDKWIWDSWYVFDGTRHHAFYLHASRALGDPERRHRHPIVGHAVSDDLVTWTVVRDALIVSESPAFDSYTTWTGSVVRDDDGVWWMFYTGTSREDGGDVQSIGAARSTDLETWTKVSTEALVTADPRHYERLDLELWHDEAWRDPWVFRFADESTWHMLITARANAGDPRSRGVMGHATSDDLLNWTVQPPLSPPGQGFGQLEVFQFEIVDGVPIVLFCCGWREYAPDRLEREGRVSGTFSVVCGERLDDLDFTRAERFDEIYAGRLVHDPVSGWHLIGFIDHVDGEFVGELCDPIPVTADPVRGLVRR
ncbi:MAG: glycosyl hydrolase family 32 [Microcella sp.]|uniref:glycosyl hydrolase family 32 n=1 Tax=Microcella sp. TaxID=1913979 RepID=UPI002725F0AA|nr:glycosyl hydrolase family 32 [Microcella sp.]MDO8336947.1 glycosyl hydrolase family 32 [Microcella sp.]